VPPASLTRKALAVQLRRCRARHILRIIWRDLNRLAATMETTRDVSWLAEACIERALTVCQAQLEAKFGVPTGRRSGERQELVVIAMGKLGARELNLSSDIDLIFAFPESGETLGARRSLANEEFFTRLGRALIAALDTTSAEGFVFRVDMRLRPYGESGPLASSFAALEAYYQEQGRDWERYAMVKARPVTGPPQARERLERLLQPFVYRRYIDFSAIDSLRSMKQLILAEVRRRELGDNVKLGSGGIREVEFIVQCFQLIRGGRDRLLRQRELLPVLDSLAELNCLPAEVCQRLARAYCFLRDTEHALQAWEDRQTQQLPVDETPRLALAHSMGFADWEAFAAALAAHRAAVEQHFAELIAEPEALDADAQAGALLWGPRCDESALAELGFADPAGARAALDALFASRRVQSLQAAGRERLDRCMPMLLRAAGEARDPDLALARLLPLVAAVARRSAYLLLLIENPPALADLVRLCGASPWIAELLTSRPALLDELLDRASLYTAPEREVLADELRQQLARLATDDLEGHMEALRYFKASQVLRVAASELAERLPLMKVSDKLSFIAEVCLTQVLELAWAQLTSATASRRGTVTATALRSLPTASSAVSSSATRRTSTSYSSSMRSPGAAPAASAPSTTRRSTRASASASSTSSRRAPPWASCTRWTCACGRPVRRGSSCPASRPLTATSARMPGPGNSRRWSARAPWPVTER
jgi:glutamate-ammonia-ligase adenylyltransferase